MLRPPAASLNINTASASSAARTGPSGSGKSSPAWSAAGCSAPVVLQAAVQRSFCPWCWRFGWPCPRCWTARSCWARCDAAGWSLCCVVLLVVAAVIVVCYTDRVVYLPETEMSKWRGRGAGVWWRGKALCLWQRASCLLICRYFGAHGSKVTGGSTADLTFFS